MGLPFSTTVDDLFAGVGVLDERYGRPEVDAGLDDFVTGDAEIVPLEIGALDVWLLGGHAASSF